MIIILAENNKSARVQVARAGTFDHEIYGRFSITAGDLRKMKFGLDTNVRRQTLSEKPVLPFDYRHEEGDRAAGWITSLALGKDSNGIDALFAEVEWTPKAVEKIRGNEFKFVSPSIQRGYKDAETGIKYDIILKGATLTNVPFLRDMEAVHLLSEDRRAAFESLKLSGDTDVNIHGVENMPTPQEVLSMVAAMTPEEKKTLLDALASQMEGEIMKEKTLLAEQLKTATGKLELSEKSVTDLTKQLTGAGKPPAGTSELEERLRLSETETETTKRKLAEVVKTMAEKETQSEFNLMLSEGKVCEAQREPFMRNDMAAFAKNAQEVKLFESGNGAKGDETGDAAEKILKLTEERVEKYKMPYGDAMSLTLIENPALRKQAGY